MMKPYLSRRRFLSLTVNALAFSASTAAMAVAMPKSKPSVVSQWRGILFGAEVNIRFIGVSQLELDDYLPKLLKCSN